MFLSENGLLLFDLFSSYDYCRTLLVKGLSMTYLLNSKGLLSSFTMFDERNGFMLGSKLLLLTDFSDEFSKGLSFVIVFSKGFDPDERFSYFVDFFISYKACAISLGF
jgi:hypothetical protein